MLPGRLSPEFVETERAANFNLIQNPEGYFVADRGIADSFYDGSLKPQPGYDSLLPTYFRKSFSQLVPWMIDQHHGGPLKALDLGCGAGKVLLELAGEFGGGIELTGITARSHITHIGVGADRRSNYDEFERLGIDVRTADVHHLDREFKKGSLDLIFSVFAGEYLADPGLVLEMIYGALKVGGVALLQDYPLPIEDSVEEYCFKAFLRDQYCVTIGHDEYGFLPRNTYKLAFQKLHPSMELPLAYDGVWKKPELPKDYLTNLKHLLTYTLVL